MQIALIGYGKMGKMVEAKALERGHGIVERLSSALWNQSQLQDADICIEFTTPNAVLGNIKKAAAMRKSIVIGTTGWNLDTEEFNLLAEQYQIGILHSPNFSIGVHLLLEVLPAFGRMMSPFPQYDVAGVEYHHNQKKDSPSGTALALTKALQSELPRAESLEFNSIRCGSFPGTHTILFDSPCDTITITHTARNREGFAEGAVIAAEWLQGKVGVYTFKDCMQSIIGQSIAPIHR